MWVTTTDGDLVDIRGAWITRLPGTTNLPFRILAKFPVGAEYGGSKFSFVTLGEYLTANDCWTSYLALRQAVMDNEHHFSLFQERSA